MHLNLPLKVLRTLTLLLATCASPTRAAAQAPSGFSWGVSGNGVLGNGLPLADRNFPGPVLDAAGNCCLDGLVDIQGADTHSLALDSAQRVFTWGSSYSGQLGIGTTGPNAQSEIPVQVPGLIGRLPTAPAHETIAAEGGHNLVIDSNGALWTWGANDHGQLGIGAPGTPTCGGPSPFVNSCSTVPVQVALGAGNIVGVGAGARHSMAIVGDCAGGPADAYAWGQNSSEQLGDGTNSARYTPVQVHGPLGIGFLSGVAKMVGGQGHTVALMCNGEVFSWGDNGNGQLGSGSTANSNVPTQVVTECPPGVPPPRPLLGCPLTNIIDIAAGFEHSLAADNMGNVWFWGSNRAGQLCDGSTTDLLFASHVALGAQALTTAPAGLPLDIVAAGAEFSLILTAQNSLLACGSGGVGQLGDCNNSASSVPVQVREGPACSMPFTGVMLVEAGESFGLMLADHAFPSATPTATTSPISTATASPTPTVTRTSTATATRTTSTTPTRTPTERPTPTPTCDLPISILISTGQNDATVGSADPLWTVAVQPSGLPVAATVITASTAWTTLPDSQWIATGTNCTLGCPAGVYDFEICWEQCGDLENIHPMMVLADNRASVFLDGNFVAATPQNGFNTATSFSFSPNPGPGLHRLLVRVQNDGGPAGMNFSGTLDGSVRFIPCASLPTPTPTATSTATSLPTSTPTATSTFTPTATASVSSTPNPTSSPTETSTHTPTASPSPSPTGCIPPPTDMVAWLTGDNTGADISGHANHATLQGASTYSAGRVADAFLVSAQTDFLTVADHPSLNFTGNFSIDAWVRTTTSSTATIIDKRGGTAANPVGYHLFISAAHLGFQLGDGSAFLNHIAPGPPIISGNWHHVAVTVDRSSPSGGRLFIDGAVVHTFDPTSRPGSVVNTSSLRIGQRYFAGQQPFNGAIDEVEIFDRTLAASEIQAIFAAGASGKCKPPRIPCVGDCDGNGQVTVDELIAGISIALGSAALSACPQFDANHDGTITVDEIIIGINKALVGCPPAGGG